MHVVTSLAFCWQVAQWQYANFLFFILLGRNTNATTGQCCIRYCVCFTATPWDSYDLVCIRLHGSLQLMHPVVGNRVNVYLWIPKVHTFVWSETKRLEKSLVMVGRKMIGEATIHRNRSAWFYQIFKLLFSWLLPPLVRELPICRPVFFQFVIKLSITD